MFNLISLKNSFDNVKGFNSGGINSGMKPNNIPDLGFIKSNTLCNISAVFTENKFAASPIKHFQKYPHNFKTNFILVNSKNANAMTGENGILDIEEILNALQEEDNDIKNPIMSSTGVIGYRLHKEKIKSCLKKFNFKEKNSNNFANSIMTTDKFKKEICFRVEAENCEPFHIAGICKGAGMINPSMATMLCFIITDAAITKSQMDEVLKEAVAQSFNKISVDGDTSTNDSVFLLSNGQSGAYHELGFKTALFQITKYLALEILKDGEGSKKIVSFNVLGAKNNEEARTAAICLSNSLLVKTALHGEDPNWGRIASTIGASKIECYEERLEIYYDDILIHSKNQPQLTDELELKAKKIMKKESFKITCKLGVGDGKFEAFGCDIGHEYININANYRT